MPGPITLILKKKDSIPYYVNNEKDTIAVRMATSKTLEKLIKMTGSPIFMTSVNQSGESTCMSLDDIEKMPVFRWNVGRRCCFWKRKYNN